MYLKHKGKDYSTIKFFSEDHGKNLLQKFNSWERPSKSEVKKFEKLGNVVNLKSNKGDFTQSNGEQASD